MVVNRSRLLGPRVLLIVAAAAAIILTAGPAQAVTRTWDDGASGASWNGAANWSGNTIPGAADIARFNVKGALSDPSLTVPATTYQAKTLQIRSAGWDIGGSGLGGTLILKATSGQNAISTWTETVQISGVAGTNTVSAGVKVQNNQDWKIQDTLVGTGVDMTISGSVAGNGSKTVTKTGTGTLALTGSSANGATSPIGGAFDVNVDAGNVELGKDGTAIAVSSITGIASGSTVKFTGGTLSGNQVEFRVELDGGTLDMNGHNESMRRLDGASGTVTNTDASNLATLTVGEVDLDSTFGGSLDDGAGTLALTKIGTGTLTLTGNSTYSGLTTLGELLNESDNHTQVGHNSALGTGDLRFRGARLSSDSTTARTLANDVTFDAGNGVSAYLGDATNNGKLTFNGAANFANDERTIQVDSDVEIAGVLSDGAGAGDGDIIKTGTGTLTLSGNNSYAGPTTVSAGVLNIQHNNALGTTAGNTSVTSGAALEMQGGITVASGETLTLNGGSGIGGNGALRSVSGENTWDSTVTVTSDTTVGVDADKLTISDSITGGGNTFNKVGSGILRLGGGATANTGLSIDVEAGTVELWKADGTYNVGNIDGIDSAAVVRLMQNNQISDSGDVTVSGGTFNTASESFGSVDDTIDELTLISGEIIGGGTLTAGATMDVRSGSVSVVLAGGGVGLNKTTSGTVTLSQANTYTGATSVSAGTLLVTGSLTSDVTVTAGAFGGGGQVDDLTLSGGTHAPGTSPGIDYVDNYNLGAAATLQIEIDGLAGAGASGGHDQVDATGSVTLAGTLATVVANGWTPDPANDVFVLIENDAANAVSGTFSGLAEGDTVTLSNDQGNFDFAITYAYDSATSSPDVGNDVALIPEPSVLVVIGAGALTLLARRKRRRQQA